jgi:hypothetical protein
LAPACDQAGQRIADGAGRERHHDGYGLAGERRLAGFLILRGGGKRRQHQCGKDTNNPRAHGYSGSRPGMELQEAASADYL